MDVPSALYWVLFVVAFVAPGPGAYYLFFASWTFGSLAVVPPAMIGGISLTPAWVSAVLLIMKSVIQVGAGRYISAMLDLRRFGIFTLCTIYVVFSAIALPRLFAGKVDVVVMHLVSYATPEPLQPSAANFTQTFYFLVTYFATISLYFAASEPRSRRDLFNAFRFGALLVFLSGVADLLTQSVGQKVLLAPFRNAQYVIETDQQVLNMRRVIGLSNEPSAFADLCMWFLAFLLLASTRPKGMGRPLTKWALCVCLALAMYMSTSSGGLVGLGALLFVYVGMMGLDFVRFRRTALIGFFILACGACALLALWIYQPELYTQPTRLIDAMVFQKQASSSYMERSMWNRTAFGAFLQSHYLGAGMGSARASSWIYAILGNIGLPGAILLGLFLLQILLTPTKRISLPERDLLRAARFAMIPNLLIESLSGTSVAFGLGTAFLVAVSASIVRPAVTEASAAAAPRRNLGWRPRPVNGAMQPAGLNGLVSERGDGAPSV